VERSAKRRKRRGGSEGKKGRKSGGDGDVYGQSINNGAVVDSGPRNSSGAGCALGPVAFCGAAGVEVANSRHGRVRCQQHVQVPDTKACDLFLHKVLRSDRPFLFMLR
jgi:hypothetical protein